MTISDERLADARARFIGAKLRVDDEGMVEVPLDYLDEAVLAFEEVQQSRTTADTEQDGKGVKGLPDPNDVARWNREAEAEAFNRLATAQGLSTLSNAPQQKAVPSERISEILRGAQLRTAEEISDAVLNWMVEHEWLDAGSEYDAKDVLEALNDNAAPDASPSPASPAPSQDGVATDEMVERFGKAFWKSNWQRGGFEQIRTALEAALNKGGE